LPPAETFLKKGSTPNRKKACPCQGVAGGFDADGHGKSCSSIKGVLMMRCFRLVITVVLTVAAGATADLASVRQLVEQRQYAEALPLLRLQFNAEPADPEVNFLFGQALFATGDYEAAVMAFERVLMQQPQNSRARLELGQSYLRLGVLNLAQSYFTEVLATNPPPAVRQNIEMLLTEIRKAQRQHFFSGALALGVHWDSNVNVAPVTSTITLPILPNAPLSLASEVEDSMLSLTLSLQHLYRQHGTDWAWKSNLLNYNAFYAREHGHDINYLSLSSGLLLDRAASSTELAAVYEYMDKGYEHHLSAPGLQFSYIKRLHPQLYASFGSKMLYKKYQQAPQRDALMLNANAGVIAMLAGCRLTLRLDYERENVRGSSITADEESYKKLAGSIQLDRQLSVRFGVYGRYRYEQRDYDGIYSAFNDWRVDRVSQYMLGGNWRLSDSLSLDLSHTLTESGSNLALYQYRRQVTALTAAWRF